MYSEKVTKCCEISTVDLTITTWDKSTMEISQKFVAFSEYMNFTRHATQKDEIDIEIQNLNLYGPLFSQNIFSIFMVRIFPKNHTNVS